MASILATKSQLHCSSSHPMYSHVSQVARQIAWHRLQTPVRAVEDGGRRADNDAIGTETGERGRESEGVGGGGGSCGSEYSAVCGQERLPKQQTKDDPQAGAGNHVTEGWESEWNHWFPD